MCPNRPSLPNTSPTSAPTPNISLSSTSSTASTINAIASNSVAAAVTSNLADSIDIVAGHFSPAHQTYPLSASLITGLSSNQPTPIPASQATTTIASSAPSQVVIGSVDTTTINKEESPSQPQPLQLMNDTLITNSVAKNTLFGLEMPFDVISAGYAALVATGGIIGYVKAGSIPSLAAGLTFGSILGVGAYMTSV